MDKIFGNAYRGDPGVPHTDPDRFVNIWIGSFAFSALTWFNPYMWQLSNAYKVMCYERVGFIVEYGVKDDVMGLNSLIKVVAMNSCAEVVSQVKAE
ncbi:Aminopeptidase-like protein AC3.5 [Cinnamomum micranthum f. kanehirae]|uniref:Aminopeptidase-like protein AC3.5 n=1 Tax=Cinnamomum micranthum f. kanehirae TaxID=337451 RepID=A0A443NCD8_9MAGN|nr:Aminopeptidase-like protein AC3.5 [Cinnamomum micranthum f. kanehirae]